MEGRKPGACRGEGTAEHCAQHILWQSLDFSSASSLQADVCVGVWAVVSKAALIPCLLTKHSLEGSACAALATEGFANSHLPGGIPSHL